MAKKNINHQPAQSGKSVRFITGSSTGFGCELPSQPLAPGYRTVVTARQPEAVKTLAALGEALVLPLDVTDQSQIDKAIPAAEPKTAWETVSCGADFPKK